MNRTSKVFTASILIVLAFTALAAAGAVLLFSHTISVPAVTDSSVTPPPNDTSSASSGSMPSIPVRLTIPSINVNAPIIQVGLAKDGSMDVPSGPSDTAWYKLGPRPGMQGSAVIDGHYGPWRTGAHSVFDNVSQLQKGDKVYVTDDKGQSFEFAVIKSQLYDPSKPASEIFNKTDGVYLNLITCNGQWLPSQKTYTNRLVVFTQLVQ